METKRNNTHAYRKWQLWSNRNIKNKTKIAKYTESGAIRYITLKWIWIGLFIFYKYAIFIWLQLDTIGYFHKL